jgi:hypothetical protein
MHLMIRFPLQQRCPQGLFRIAGENVIRALQNIVGRMRRHVSIWVQRHYHKRCGFLASGTLDILLDALVEVLIHNALVETRCVQQCYLVHTHFIMSCNQGFRRPNIPQRTETFRARC